jgi:outer membrane protein TolC
VSWSFHVFGAIAHFERRLIAERTKDGIAAARAPLQKQLAVQRDLLTALIGRFPSEERVEEFDLASLQLPQELPVSLPSKVVEQRPDIQAAEPQLHSASASIGVAVAAILPQFALTGNAGTTSGDVRRFVSGR